MKYLKFFRWPNLVIILFTMIFVRYCVIWPPLRQLGPEALMPWLEFLLLVVSFVLIAAGGYVINDLSDTDVDSLNKPDKMLIGSAISFKKANYIYLMINILVAVLAVALAFLLKSWRLGLIILMMVGLLWFYSKRYKRIMLIGNLVVATASSMSIVIVWLAQFFYLALHQNLFVEASLRFQLIFEPLIAFTVFAFLASFIREIVKDIEDIQGDKRFGCQTFPVVFGLRAARWLALLLLLLMITLLISWQYKLICNGRILMAWSLAIVLIISVIAWFKIARAKEKRKFHQASLWLKAVMASGIASMLFLPY